MNKFKIEYTSLRNLKASTFVEAVDPAEALKAFHKKYGCYKTTKISEVHGH